MYSPLSSYLYIHFILDFKYILSLVHSIVSCREIDKSGSCDHAPMVAIFYVLSEVQYLDGAWVFFMAMVIDCLHNRCIVLCYACSPVMIVQSITQTMHIFIKFIYWKQN